MFSVWRRIGVPMMGFRVVVSAIRAFVRSVSVALVAVSVCLGVGVLGRVVKDVRKVGVRSVDELENRRCCVACRLSAH